MPNIGQTASRLYYATSEDSFLPHPIPFLTTYIQQVHIIALPNGTIIIGTIQDWHLLLQSSSDNFQTIIDVQNATGNANRYIDAFAFTSDANSNLLIVANESPENDQYGTAGVAIINATDWSHTYLAPSRRAIDSYNDPAIAVDSTGQIHVVWRQYVDSNNRTIKYARSGNSYTIQTIFSSGGNDPMDPAIVIDSQDKVYITFIDRSTSTHKLYL